MVFAISMFVCLNLCKTPRLFGVLYILTKIDQIDPISLDLIAFYIQRLIVQKLMFYIFPDCIISKEGLLLNDIIKQKKLPAIFVNAVKNNSWPLKTPVYCSWWSL